MVLEEDACETTENQVQGEDFYRTDRRRYGMLLADIDFSRISQEHGVV